MNFRLHPSFFLPMSAQPEFFVVGVDGGASKTAAIIMDQTGHILGRGQSGSSNYHNVGLDNAGRNLQAAMNAAAERAGMELTQAAAVTWALAGVGRPADRILFADLAAEMLPGIPVQIEHDTVAALMGGLGSRQGIVLIAGTGMCVYGENRDKRARAGGWGYFLDRGSAHGLAQEALRAVAQAADGRAPTTRLTSRILEALDLSQPEDIVGWVYDPQRELAEIAALAPLVLEEAEAGDLAAINVVAEGAEALAATVAAVAHRLDFGANPFYLVLAGGLHRNAFYRRLVSQAVRTRVPGAHPIKPRADAAAGAGLLALESTSGVSAAHWTPAPEIALAPGNVWSSEQPNVLTRDLDLHATLTLVGLMHVQDKQAVAATGQTLPVIAGAVDDIAERMSRGGRLIYVGAGSSGRLGVIDAAECGPTFGLEPGRVVAVIAGGAQAISNSVEGAEDDTDDGAATMRKLAAGPLDTVVGIAASGRTPFVLGAMEEARRQGALTIALVCNLPAPLADLATHVIAPLVGPEAVAGSTRLKAGTAQKLVLNMLSTGVMVRLGKTYGNLMVNVRTENRKLRARARRIIAQAGDISEDAAAVALDAAGGDVRAAIVSILRGCSVDEARLRLAQSGGVVRLALQDEVNND